MCEWIIIDIFPFLYFYALLLQVYFFIFLFFVYFITFLPLVSLNFPQPKCLYQFLLFHWPNSILFFPIYYMFSILFLSLSSCSLSLSLCIIILLLSQMVPVQPGAHPLGHVPFTWSQISPLKQWPHVSSQFPPNVNSWQAVIFSKKYISFKYRYRRLLAFENSHITKL